MSQICLIAVITYLALSVNAAPVQKGVQTDPKVQQPTKINLTDPEVQKVIMDAIQDQLNKRERKIQIVQTIQTIPEVQETVQSAPTVQEIQNTLQIIPNAQPTTKTESKVQYAKIVQTVPEVKQFTKSDLKTQRIIQTAPEVKQSTNTHTNFGSETQKSTRFYSNVHQLTNSEFQQLQQLNPELWQLIQDHLKQTPDLQNVTKTSTVFRQNHQKITLTYIPVEVSQEMRKKRSPIFHEDFEEIEEFDRKNQERSKRQHFYNFYNGELSFGSP